MKVLIADLYLDDQLAQEFELEMNRVMVLDEEPVELAFVRPKADPQIKLPEDISAYTRLLVSGSEASAREDNGWDEALVSLIKSFVETGKPVLGICYGHQFVIRALVGRSHVRKRTERVWGWLDMELAPSLLSQGLERVVCVTCNSDEVFDLPGEYRTLAGAEHCGILAFEHREKPIWGVQFHPEYEKDLGQSVLDFVIGAQDPQTYQFLDQRQGENPLDPNTTLFANFLKA